jgi:hypothetical protein
VSAILVVTPNAYKRMKAGIKAMRSDLRAMIAESREWSRLGDKERAEDVMMWFCTRHRDLQEKSRALRAVKVVKYSNLSPNAAVRESHRRGSK